MKDAPVQMPHHGHVPHGIRMKIPWRIHQKAWEVYAKHYPGQSAETMAQRGGFDLEELIYFLSGENPLNQDDNAMFTDFFNKWTDDIEKSP